jgi:hypothetical protein
MAAQMNQLSFARSLDFMPIHTLIFTSHHEHHPQPWKQSEIIYNYLPGNEPGFLWSSQRKIIT